MTTLFAMIGAAVAGAWLGAGGRVGLVAPARAGRHGGPAARGRRDHRGARHGSVPGGGGALGLSGTALAIGVAGNFILGAVMTLGIGLYAPCMILVALLGMNAKTAYPDHDGLVRVPHAGGQRALRAIGPLRPARRAGPDAGRGARVDRRGPPRQGIAPHSGQMARRRRRGLHCARHAAIGQPRSPVLNSPLFKTKSVDQLQSDADLTTASSARSARPTSSCSASAPSSARASSCARRRPPPTTPARR